MISNEMRYVYNCIGHELKIPDIVDSQGMCLIDSHGKKYMDLESGVWCIPLGHNVTRLNNRIFRQCESLMQSGFSYSHTVVDSAAEQILRLTGFKGGKCVFLCSGSEAIEISRQISKHISGHGTSMTLHDSYLGAYSSVSDRRKGWYVFDWSKCESCASNNNCPGDCGLLQEELSEVPCFRFVSIC
jgi:acetylornithine aminotransferase